MTTLEVISPGALTTIQDLGRPGWAQIGVPRSGAVDRPALMLANGLVGNPDGAPGLETTLIGPKLRATDSTVIALTGAEVTASTGDRAVPMFAPFALAAGELLSVGPARSGLRTYIAFQGGIEAPLTLGSAATDVLTGLGPAPLRRGDVLTLDVLRVEQLPTVRSLSTRTPAGSPDTEQVLRLVLGPRDDRFTTEAIRRLTAEPFTVTPASNRIGLRLDGPPLEQLACGELLSEGIVPGAIQVPPDGQPILLLADHPTTGGYPVIAVLKDEDLPVAGQLRPGRQVSFEVFNR